MGTAMYMSPEQWKTTSVDIRSDIYSLGCSLYHLLTGSPPFLDSDLKPEKAHERLAPPSARHRGDVPKTLDAVIRKMMAKSPDFRFQTPAEVATALAPFVQDADLRPLVLAHQRVPAGASTVNGARGTRSPAPTATATPSRAAAASTTRAGTRPYGGARRPPGAAGRAARFGRVAGGGRHAGVGDAGPQPACCRTPSRTSWSTWPASPRCNSTRRSTTASTRSNAPPATRRSATPCWS